MKKIFDQTWIRTGALAKGSAANGLIDYFVLTLKVIQGCALTEVNGPCFPPFVLG